MSDDPYKALGLSPSATAAEIRKAYKAIAKTSHPDLNPGDRAAEARFKAASQAYDLLKDPESRAKFDRGEIDASGNARTERGFYRDYAEAPGNPYRSAGGGGGGGGAGGFDASDIFADFLRRGQRGAEGGRGRGGFGFGGFGGGGPFAGGQGGDARGADRQFTLEVGFLDAVLGRPRRITLPEGSSIEVRLPKGAEDGQTIRLRGKGEPGQGKGPPGDALITLTVRPHPHFRREGDDILLTLPITLDEAVLGGRVEVQTIDGPVKLSIPKGASGGRVLRLRGRGVEVPGRPRGDQRVELRIVSPPKIDEELATFMEGWRKTHGYNPRKE